MHPQSRRDFIRHTVAGAGTAWLAGSHLLHAAEPVLARTTATKATDRVVFGKTTAKATFLAQGTGYNGIAHSSDHTRMGKPAFETLLRHSLEQGINFIDMADLYGTHPYFRDVLKTIKRDQVTLLSKMWPRQDYWCSPSGGAKEEYTRFCKELGTDMIDIMLIHCCMETDWPQKFSRVCDEMSELKQQGKLRAVGISCHHLDALKTGATNPWVDVIFARINNKGAAMDGSPEEVAAVLKTARANGKFIVGMKIFGAGKLTTPEAKDASLKFVLENRLVDAMTVGMKTPAEVDDTIGRLNRALKAV